jgi:hypothetical protein
MMGVLSRRKNKKNKPADVVYLHRKHFLHFRQRMKHNLIKAGHALVMMAAITAMATINQEEQPQSARSTNTVGGGAAQGMRKGKAPPRRRIRESVQEMFDGLGPTYFRRAYQMTYQMFSVLHDKLREGINNAYDVATAFRRRRARLAKQQQQRLRGATAMETAPPPLPPNGSMSTSVCLACAAAICYFA